MLQDILTYTIDVVAIVGFLGILLDHISQKCMSVRPQSISQTASVSAAPKTPAESAPTAMLSLEPTSAPVQLQEKPQSEAEHPSIADPWELPILTEQPIKPVLALCPAVDSALVTSEPTDTITSINFNKLDSAKLRKLCTQYGIGWRNARGKGKHLTKDMMIAQLEQLAVLA